MIVKKLVLHNFGIYAGTNTFTFEGKKPVVLIGGKNGRGKTTFLEAILLVLYGGNSFLFQESHSATYQQYLRSFINRADGTEQTSIRIEFVLEEDEANTYILQRSWDNRHHVHEKLTVEKNGVRQQFLEENWLHFFEGILPSGIARFFFFDGEKIAELASDQSNEELKQSIKALMGLTVLDQMNRDLTKIVRSSKKSSSVNEKNSSEKWKQISQLEKEQEADQKQRTSLSNEAQAMQPRIDEMEKRREFYQQEYLRKGGKIAENKMRHREEIGRLKEQADQLAGKMREIAAGPLPLLMVQDDLEGMLEEVKNEEERLLQNRLASQIRRIADSYNRENPGMKGKDVEKFVAFVESQGSETASEPLYNMDRFAVLRTEMLAQETLGKQKQLVEECRHSQQQIRDQIDENSQYLDSEVDQTTVEKIQQKVEELNRQIAEESLRKAQWDQKVSELDSQMKSRSQEIRRIQEKLQESKEGSETEQRTEQYAHMASEVLQTYQKRLQRRRIQNLSDLMTECYLKIASKKNFIRRVEMDPDTLNLTYLDREGEIVDPDSLSAGEKQMMVIALLWALAKASKRKLPVIIDTPLSRLDRQHRQTIVSEYYPAASDQVIILSTDSEITEEYYRMLKPNLDCEYLLEYDEDKRCTRIRKGFFEGEPVC